jgi:uncharacterized protein (UPF0332 family)
VYDSRAGGVGEKGQRQSAGAKLLADDELYDFAASRAYYTMFYVAEALLLGESLSFSKPTAVIAAFGRRFARPGVVPAEFHRYLIDGQDVRNISNKLMVDFRLSVCPPTSPPLYDFPINIEHSSLPAGKRTP